MALPTSDHTSETPLFSTDLISPEVLSALPEGYSCRPIQQGDYQKGFLDVLRVLTTVGDVTEEVCSPLLFRFLPPGGTCPIPATPSRFLPSLPGSLEECAY